MHAAQWKQGFGSDQQENEKVNTGKKSLASQKKKQERHLSDLGL
jgi:hypothetical protein